MSKSKLALKKLKIKNILTFVTVQFIAEKFSYSQSLLDAVIASTFYFSFNFKIY